MMSKAVNCWTFWLQLLLEAEKQEAKEKEKEEKRQKEKEFRQNEMEEERHCLFGPLGKLL